MGKEGSSSWLTAVKRAFRSPTKGTPLRKDNMKREEHGQEDIREEKKTVKRRWIFRKLTSHTQSFEVNVSSNRSKGNDSISTDKQRSTAAVSVSEAAKATAQEAEESVGEIRLANLVRQNYAALLIQTAFRGYLARQALCALKGIVKLQALVRGHNVRKQVKTTLKCMQALMRVQAKLHDQCSRLSVSHDAKRRSMFAESNNLWEKYKDIRQRRSMSTDENNTTDQWEKQKQPYYSTLEDLEAILQSRKESALNRDKTLAYALSQHQQVCHINLNSNQAVRYENEEEENTEYWLSDYGIASQRSRETIKNIVEVELSKVQPHSHLFDRAAENQQFQHSLSYHYQSPTSTPFSSTCNTTPLQVRSASPRCLKKGYQSHSTASTPSLRGYCHGNHQQRQKTGSPSTPATSILPNYMAATESAKARARTQRQTTTPKQRTYYTESDRELRGSVRKRLSFPISVPEPNSDGSIYTDYSCFSQDLKSPSFRSVLGGMYGLERGALDFCYSGEISPASTSRLRRWLS